jgi:hypothetical protein
MQERVTGGGRTRSARHEVGPDTADTPPLSPGYAPTAVARECREPPLMRLPSVVASATYAAAPTHAARLHAPAAAPP